MEGHAMARGEEDDEEQLRRSKLEEALEVESLRRIICAYINYPDASEEDVKRYERSYNKLPPAHKALLSHYPLKFQKLRKCISMNYHFICNMLEAFEPPFDMRQDVDRQDVDISEDSHSHQHNLCSGDGNCCPCLPMSASGRMCHNESDQNCCGWSHLDGKSSGTFCVNEEVTVEVHGGSISENHPQHYCKESEKHDGNDTTDSNGNAAPSSHECLGSSFQLDVPLVDVDKVRCIIRNIVRDWAEEGQRERDQCYKPILEELDRLFPNRNQQNPPTCLVPGAGLGRLALEISCLGFISQGNEFSYYMMICSSFILNQTETAGEWTIYPWIHSNCNSLSDSDQLRPVSIPDIHPASAGITEGFSMCGGDFVEVYGDKGHIGEWDAVVTSFFLDTAHNIVEYIEIISRILKDGGVWINLGPLLYHFADMYGREDEMSIELSLEDVKRTAMHYGLEIEKERTIKTTYTTNPKSMMQNWYYTAFWTMRKKSAALKENA